MVSGSLRTSHGKSACDGLGGTIKRLTARASLQRSFSGQILSVDAMLTFLLQKHTIYKFFNIKKDKMSDRQRHQEERLAVPGTRSYHFYEPVLNKMAVKFKRVNEDSGCCGEALFGNVPDVIEWQPMQFVACMYDGFWWIGMIEELDRELEDAQVKFMHPHGPTNGVYWPRRNDIC